MAVDIIMPKVDMVMEEGTFVEWLKQEGETVQKGEALFVVLTDKAAIEVESTESGILSGLKAKPDDIIPVAGVIGHILQPGETPAGTTPAETPNPSPLPTPRTAEHPEDPSGQPARTAASPQEAVRATPLARNLARELGLELSHIRGSGERGRIYRADVERHLESFPTVPAAAEKPRQPAATQFSPVPAGEAQPIRLPEAREKQRIPLKGPRLIIAQRMSYSANTIPHVYINMAVDMSETARLREQVKAHYEQVLGHGISYTSFIALAAAHLLQKHPLLNSSLVGGEIVLWENIHIGIAVDLEDYLIVPVLRDMQDKNLEQTAVALHQLLEKAHSRKLQPAEMSGSTFSISNLGMHGAASFTAIINPPETAILAVGKITDTAVAIQQEVAVRPMLTLTLGIDHRVIDGAEGTRFLTGLKNVLENPYLLI